MRDTSPAVDTSSIAVVMVTAAYPVAEICRAPGGPAARSALSYSVSRRIDASAAGRHT